MISLCVFQCTCSQIVHLIGSRMEYIDCRAKRDHCLHLRGKHGVKKAARNIHLGVCHVCKASCESCTNKKRANAVGIARYNYLTSDLIHNNKSKDTIEGPKHLVEGDSSRHAVFVEGTEYLAVGAGWAVKLIVFRNLRPVVNLSIAHPVQPVAIHGLHPRIGQAIDSQACKSHSDST